MQSTAEDIYTALKRAFPGNILTELKVSGVAANSPNILYNWYGAMYNLTGISTITFIVEYYYYDYNSNNGADGKKYGYNVYDVLVGVAMSKSSFNVSGKYTYGYALYDTTLTGTTEIKINVSNLSGNYYIGVGTRGYNSYNGISKLNLAVNQSYYAKILKVIFI